ncbi:nuclear transport factor 2 family protein [Brevibacterium aurantiacum]
MSSQSSDLQASDIYQFYARQTHLIDSGRHADWASTFLDEGEFHSPTYPEPAIGKDALVGISQAFAETALAANEVRRHIMTNIWIRQTNAGLCKVECVLLVTATSSDCTRVLRTMNITDDLAYQSGFWKVNYRVVRATP